MIPSRYAPGSSEKKTGRGFGRVPARGLTGGELEVAREHEEVKARRGVCLVRTGVAGWVFSHGEVRRRWLGLLAGGRAAAVGWGVERSGSCATLGQS